MEYDHLTEGATRGVSLRAHHLLCLQGFQGYGYDTAFVRGLSDMVSRLRSRPDTAVTVVDSADDVCGHCPNLKEGVCDREGTSRHIGAMDRTVLSAIGMTAGRSASASALFAEVNAAFTAKRSADAVCGGCLWQKECLWLQSRS